MCTPYEVQKQQLLELFRTIVDKSNPLFQIAPLKRTHQKCMLQTSLKLTSLSCLGVYRRHLGGRGGGAGCTLGWFALFLVYLFHKVAGEDSFRNSQSPSPPAFLLLLNNLDHLRACVQSYEGRREKVISKIAGPNSCGVNKAVSIWAEKRFKLSTCTALWIYFLNFQLLHFPLTPRLLPSLTSLYLTWPSIVIQYGKVACKHMHLRLNKW